MSKTAYVNIWPTTFCLSGDDSVYSGKAVPNKFLGDVRLDQWGRKSDVLEPPLQAGRPSGRRDQRLRRFSHDLDACARCLEPPPSLNSLASIRLRAFVRQPPAVDRSLHGPVPPPPLPPPPPARCLCCRPPLSRICLTMPTSRSSTLWLSIADTSVYLQPLSFANDLPSVCIQHTTSLTVNWLNLNQPRMKIKNAILRDECWRVLILLTYGPWARGWINHLSLWRMASAKSDLRLPSQL